MGFEPGDALHLGSGIEEIKLTMEVYRAKELGLIFAKSAHDVASFLVCVCVCGCHGGGH